MAGRQERAEQNATRMAGRAVSIPEDVEEIRLDMSTPRLIRVVDTAAVGSRKEWHLKVTSKRGLALI
jgi:hypothetical protein